MPYTTRHTAKLLFLLAMMQPAHAKTTIDQAIQTGEKFLVGQVLSDHYSLGCTSSDKAGIKSLCPYDETGEIIAGFFIAQALTSNQHMPENVRLKIIAALERDAKRIDADSFYWGDTNTFYWGYSSQTPPDSDDTSFGLQTLLLLGKKVNIEGINEFYNASKQAYTTFKHIDTSSQKPTTEVMENSIDQPPETNANVFALFQFLNLDSKINYKLIRGFQASGGYWKSYFYPGKYYSTHMNMKLLCKAEKNTKEINKGLRFLVSSQNTNGSWGSNSAYDTALATNTLIACHQRSNPATKKGMTFLLKTQTKEGFWRNDQAIWQYIPHPGSDAIQQTAYDKHHVLATALAVHALKQYKTS